MLRRGKYYLYLSLALHYVIILYQSYIMLFETKLRRGFQDKYT